MSPRRCNHSSEQSQYPWSHTHWSLAAEDLHTIFITEADGHILLCLLIKLKASKGVLIPRHGRGAQHNGVSKHQGVSEGVNDFWVGITGLCPTAGGALHHLDGHVIHHATGTQRLHDWALLGLCPSWHPVGHHFAFWRSHLSHPAPFAVSLGPILLPRGWGYLAQDKWICDWLIAEMMCFLCPRPLRAWRIPAVPMAVSGRAVLLPRPRPAVLPTFWHITLRASSAQAQVGARLFATGRQGSGQGTAAPRPSKHFINQRAVPGHPGASPGVVGEISCVIIKVLFREILGGL